MLVRRGPWLVWGVLSMIGKYSRGFIAAAFFLIWVGILYLGADHPPPVGFLWLVLGCCLAATAVYLRVQVYADWSVNRRKGRFLRVLIEGCIGGLVFALMLFLFNGNGEPGANPTWIDVVIWFLVLTAVGAVNAIAVYVGVVLVNRLTRKAST